MLGLVTRCTGNLYSVWVSEEGLTYSCRLKGTFRLKGIKSTNPVVVGDKVSISLDPTGAHVIEEILPRANCIVRKSVNLSKRSHILASNLDQAILVVSPAFPRTSEGFVDRFLVTAEAFHIPVILVINKSDLQESAHHRETRKEWKSLYPSLGYPVLEVSATTGFGLAALGTALSGKITLLAGHSGVGKSSLLNALSPGLNLKTSPLSTAHTKGMHTTTFTEMLELKPGTWVIDSPGIKELGLSDFSPREVAEGFPEFRERMSNCRFHNCLHVEEPGCSVLEALAEGEIAESRYRSYLGMLQEHQE
jgi:ribosome biogenesis GTPase